MIKKEIRVLGIDDASFDKFQDTETFVIGVFFRGGNFIEGVMSCKVTIDGTDATDKIIAMVHASKFRSQIQALFLDGIAVAGFNVIDTEKLYEKTNIPVIVVIRNYPDFKKIEEALKRLNYAKRYELIKKAGEVQRIGKIYVQYRGTTLEKVKQLLQITCTHSYLPEPVRVAHLIGAGLVKGESRGRA